MDRWLPLLLGGIFAGALSCDSNPIARDKVGLCPVALGEFGVAGCAVVTGTVVGSDGFPLPGMLVIPDQVDTCCNSPRDETDEEGRFVLTIHMITGEPHRVPASIKATCVPPRSSDPVISESASVTLLFAPAGTPPDTTRVEIALPFDADEAIQKCR